MESADLINQLKLFLTTDNASLQTLSCLKPSAQIQITVGGSEHIAVGYKDHNVVIIDGPSNRADFIFSATPAAIEILINEKDLTPAQLGIKLVKQVVSQEVSIAMPGSIFSITRKGYFDILKVGGKEFWNELKNRGITSLPKIMQALKNLKG